MVNKGSNGAEKWTESWHKTPTEQWTEKQGSKDNQSWNEKWYKRTNDSDAVLETTCEKWGRNLLTDEEWNEKWGEKLIPGQKEKWCDKWQMQVSS